MGDGGKGDTQRPTDWDKFSQNFDAIFGTKNASKDSNTKSTEGQKESSNGGTNSRPPNA